MLLSTGHNIRFSNDISCCASVRQEESTCLHLYLFDSRIGLSHVNQRIRYRRKINIRGPKSIHPSINIRIRNRRRCLHPSTNELLQQSPRSILNFPVLPLQIFVTAV